MLPAEALTEVLIAPFQHRARGGKAGEAGPERNLGVEGGQGASARREYNKDRLYSEIKLK